MTHPISPFNTKVGFGAIWQSGIVVLFTLMCLVARAAPTFDVIHSFDWTHGGYPYAGLTLGADGRLYGTTMQGGIFDTWGTVYQLVPNGAGGYTHSVLHNFDWTHGGNPVAGLTLGADGRLYGTTQQGGTSGYGTVYQLVPNGAGGYTHSVLHNFDGTFDGTLGRYPTAGLTLGADGRLYGTTEFGGTKDLSKNNLYNLTG